MNDESVYLLCLAIVKRAVKDYRAACRVRPGKSVTRCRDELERFFRGPWFELMTGGQADPEALMSKIKRGEIHVRLAEI